MDIRGFLTNSKTVTGLEFCTTNGGIKIFVCTLKKDKTKIRLIEKKEIFSENLEQYLSSLKNGFRVLISGKGVLAQNSEAFSQNDFWIQEFGETKFILRKDSLDNQLSELTNRVNFSGFLLGGTLMKWAKETLQLFDLQSMCYTSAQFERANWDLEVKKITLGEQEIDSNFTGAYLTALSVFLKDTIATATPELEKNFFENLLIKNTVKYTGVFLLFFAVANFFYFDYLNNKNQELSTNYESKIELQKEFEKVKNDLDIKNKLLEDLGGSKKLFQSYYCDQISFSVPNSVLLTKIFVAPLNDEIYKKEQRLEFDKKNILIQGNTNSAVDFNKWVDVLKNNEWIEKIEIENYRYDSQTNKSMFNLKVILK